MVPSVPMGQGEERSSIDSAPDVSNLGTRLALSAARAVRGISTLTRFATLTGPFQARFAPTAEGAYNDLAEFLELTNDLFSKYDSELPDVEDLAGETYEESCE